MKERPLIEINGEIRRMTKAEFDNYLAETELLRPDPPAPTLEERVTDLEYLIAGKEASNYGNEKRIVSV